MPVPTVSFATRYLKPVLRTLDEMGYTNITVVKEQEQPNGKFPTCLYPNPEIIATSPAVMSVTGTVWMART